jgi:hypothetical protein
VLGVRVFRPVEVSGDLSGLTVDSSPEKAGGGGSIPSLATMFSISYRPSKTQFHSTSFQYFWSIEICLRRNEARLESVTWGRIELSSCPVHFLPKRQVLVITVTAVITVVTTPAPSKTPAADPQRLSGRSARLGRPTTHSGFRRRTAAYSGSGLGFAAGLGAKFQPAGVPRSNRPGSLRNSRSLREYEWAVCNTPGWIVAFSDFTVRPLLSKPRSRRPTRQNVRTSAPTVTPDANNRPLRCRLVPVPNHHPTVNIRTELSKTCGGIISRRMPKASKRRGNHVC